MLSAPLIAVAAAGGTLVLLVLLFAVEERRGGRIGERMRAACDAAIERVQMWWRGWFPRVVVHPIRQSLHYIVHEILTLALRILKRIEQLIHAVVQFNRSRARRARPSNTGQHGPFSEVIEHKRSVRKE